MKTNIQFVNNLELIKILNDKNTAIIIDSQILQLYPNKFQQLSNKIITVDNTKKIKTLKNFSTVIKKLIKLQTTKNTHLIGIGGGEITDLTGFIASTYMRGIKVSFVPTTLLAMVDAAVGGKNSLNFGNLKNIIGTIYQPQNIFVNLNFLKNLPQIQLLSGFAEILKIGFLFDKSLLENCIELIDFNELNGLKLIIEKSINHKIKIVEEDEFDKNKRKLLNFGHTVGHILELKYGLPHGEAIAYGMIFEAKLAKLLKHTNDAVFEEINRIITKYFTKPLEDFNLKNITNKIIFDKKNINDKISLTVIKEIGFAELIEVEIEDFKRLTI